MLSTLCASLRRRHAHGHFSRAILYGNVGQKGPRTPLGHRFARACAIDMHMGIIIFTQEQFRMEICLENAKKPRLRPTFCASLSSRNGAGPVQALLAAC